MTPQRISHGMIHVPVVVLVFKAEQKEVGQQGSGNGWLSRFSWRVIELTQEVKAYKLNGKYAQLVHCVNISVNEVFVCFISFLKSLL